MSDTSDRECDSLDSRTQSRTPHRPLTPSPDADPRAAQGRPQDPDPHQPPGRATCSPASTTPCSRAAAWSSPRCASTCPATRCARSTGTSPRASAMPYVKSFTEERELTVMLLVDASASTRFGSVQPVQAGAGRRARGAARLLGDHQQRQGRAGHLHRPHRAGAAAAQGQPPRAARHPRDPQPRAAGPRHRHPARARPPEPGRRAGAASTFLLSDFLAPDLRRPLRVANRRHDLIAVVLEDPRESELPDVGLVALEDPESGETVVVDTVGPRACAPSSRRRQRARARRARPLPARARRRRDQRPHRSAVHARAAALLPRARERRR